MKGVLRLAVATLFVAMLTGCTDDILSGLGGSGGDFSISVGSGTSPTYSWSGAAFSVDVVRTSNQSQVVWRISDPTTPRNITAPVRHGVVPNGAIESSALERTLTPGIRYRVTVSLDDGRSAFQDFTP